MTSLGQVVESLKDLPAKTDEMLEHLSHIEALLSEIAKDIAKLASE